MVIKRTRTYEPYRNTYCTDTIYDIVPIKQIYTITDICHELFTGFCAQDIRSVHSSYPYKLFTGYMYYNSYIFYNIQFYFLYKRNKSSNINLSHIATCTNSHDIKSNYILNNAQLKHRKIHAIIKIIRYVYSSLIESYSIPTSSEQCNKSVQRTLFLISDCAKLINSIYLDNRVLIEFKFKV